MSTTVATRTITVFSSQGENGKKIQFTGETWGELKKVLSNSYNINSMKAVENQRRSTLENPGAKLPEGDFNLHLFPVKTKSGATPKKGAKKAAKKAAPKKAAKKAAPKKAAKKAAPKKAATKTATKAAAPKKSTPAKKNVVKAEPVAESPALSESQLLEQGNREHRELCDGVFGVSCQ